MICLECVYERIEGIHFQHYGPAGKSGLADVVLGWESNQNSACRNQTGKAALCEVSRYVDTRTVRKALLLCNPAGRESYRAMIPGMVCGHVSKRGAVGIASVAVARVEGEWSPLKETAVRRFFS